MNSDSKISGYYFKTSSSTQCREELSNLLIPISMPQSSRFRTALRDHVGGSNVSKKSRLRDRSVVITTSKLMVEHSLRLLNLNMYLMSLYLGLRLNMRLQLDLSLHLMMSSRVMASKWGKQWHLVVVCVWNYLGLSWCIDCHLWCDCPISLSNSCCCWGEHENVQLWDQLVKKSKQIKSVQLRDT